MNPSKPTDPSPGAIGTRKQKLVDSLEAIVALGLRLHGFAQQHPAEVFDAARAALESVVAGEAMVFFEWDEETGLSYRPDWCSAADGARQLRLDVARAFDSEVAVAVLAGDLATLCAVPGTDRSVRLQAVATPSHVAGVLAMQVSPESAPIGELESNLLSVIALHCASAIELNAVARRIEAELGRMESMLPDVREAREAATAENSSPGLRVLVAENDDVNQKITARILGRLGCAVEVATDGATAARVACANAFDLIFMDCEMPVLDGYGATVEIRRAESSAGRARRTPIIGVAEISNEGDRDACRESGMDDLMSRPVKQADLKSMLERWVASR